VLCPYLAMPFPLRMCRSRAIIKWWLTPLWQVPALLPPVLYLQKPRM
jgi:hypothetical protein